MRDVVEIARTMGPEQLFLALVFLASYALALGEFATARGRLWAVVHRPGRRGRLRGVEHIRGKAAIVLVACASVGMALFSATRLGAVAGDDARARRAAVDQAPATNLPRARAVPSSRSVKTAPILNSPAAE